jgi:hypothetical protein
MTVYGSNVITKNPLLMNHEAFIFFIHGFCALISRISYLDSSEYGKWNWIRIRNPDLDPGRPKYCSPQKKERKKKFHVKSEFSLTGGLRA